MGPKFNPTRVLKTGSVTIVKPSIRSSTVVCPSHAAWMPRSGHACGFGRDGAGRTCRLRSAE
jgi:hypothetical protein